MQLYWSRDHMVPKHSHTAPHKRPQPGLTYCIALVHYGSSTFNHVFDEIELGYDDQLNEQRSMNE